MFAEWRNQERQRSYPDFFIPDRPSKSLNKRGPREFWVRSADIVLMRTEMGLPADSERPRPDTHQKALKINLDPLRYGSFAEIGAGQEVARWFFKVGAAAGTISKSMSAYDMAVSDAIYGR